MLLQEAAAAHLKPAAAAPYVGQRQQQQCTQQLLASQLGAALQRVGVVEVCSQLVQHLQLTASSSRAAAAAAAVASTGSDVSGIT